MVDERQQAHQEFLDALAELRDRLYACPVGSPAWKTLKAAEEHCCSLRELARLDIDEAKRQADEIRPVLERVYAVLRERQGGGE